MCQVKNIVWLVLECAHRFYCRKERTAKTIYSVLVIIGVKQVVLSVSITIISGSVKLPTCVVVFCIYVTFVSVIVQTLVCHVCSGLIWRPALSAGTDFCQCWKNWADGSVWKMKNWTNRCPSEETCPHSCNNTPTARLVHAHLVPIISLNFPNNFLLKSPEVFYPK